MKINTLGLFLITALALCAGAGLVALGAALGPLNPPSGPVSSTNKTLAEIEPRTAVNATNTPGNTFALFRITQPGSYYLTSNISIPSSNSWAIEIAANGVTLDLNGYTINGNGNGNGNNVGGIVLSLVSVVGEPKGVAIRNGTITNITRSGITPSSFPNGAQGVIVENVRVLNVSSTNGGVNGIAGIYLGRGGSAINCYVANAPTGITTSFSARVINSTAEFCTFSGFDIGGGSVIQNCVAVGIFGGPTDGHGFVLRTGSQATNCNSRSNTGDGFVLEESSVALDCSSSNNTGAGYRLNSRARLERCSADVNTDSGVATTTGSAAWSIERCTITEHASVSIRANGNQGKVSNNTIHGTNANGSIGILVPSNCDDMLISGNRFTTLYRAVQVDGGFVIATNNVLNFVFAFVVNSAGVPLINNFVAPVLGPSEAATATNPFANIKI
jgi:hypothetical protein